MVKAKILCKIDVLENNKIKTLAERGVRPEAKCNIRHR